MPPEAVEGFRALLPVGYAAGVRAYKRAAESLDERALTHHYTEGLDFFHHQFVPHLKRTLHDLAGGAWCLDDFIAYAAGSDVDLMGHLVDAVASREVVSLYPGDWFGFQVGSAHAHNILWDAGANSGLACLCIPSVRNGHFTPDMAAFLTAAPACLLNINLFPTLPPAERRSAADALAPVLHKSVLSVSFSRGFGLTASQLGVFLMHRDHPYRRQFGPQLDWFTYFHNALAARAFMAIDLGELQRADDLRRQWVTNWLRENRLPAVETGTYYVKSFRVEGSMPDRLRALSRGDVVRLCMKPPITSAGPASQKDGI